MKTAYFFTIITLIIFTVSCSDDETKYEQGFSDTDTADNTVDFDYTIVDTAVETDDETVETDDDTVETDDDTVETDDETVETDDETVETDDETVETDDDTVETDDETVETDDETAETDDETAETDDPDQSDDDTVTIPENVIFVKHDASGLNDGTSWENAYTDLSVALQYLIENHLEGKNIWVAKGTYHPTDCPNLYGNCTSSREYHFTLMKGVTLFGGFNGDENTLDQRDFLANETVLSGDLNNDDTTSGNSENAYHVFYHDGWEIKDNTAVLDGFTISGGNANGDSWPNQEGGGIRNNENSDFGYGHSSPTIRNCIFKDNYASLAGGAMYNHEGASPIIENCTFANNQSDKGGAIHNYLGHPSISGSTFTGNVANTGGGAVSIDTSDVAIENCTFSNNTAGAAAGAVSIRGLCSVLIENSVFSGNAASNGGALSNAKSSTLSVTNTYFMSNSATGSSLPNGLGGAIYNNEAVATVINSVFSANSAVMGGAMVNLKSAVSIINSTINGNSGNGIANGQSDPVISNVIIYGNTGSNIYNLPEGTYGFAKSTPVFSYSDIGGCGGSSSWTAACGTDSGGNIDSDPLFINSGDYPLALSETSPCINTGDSSKIPVSITEDLAGSTRIQGTSIDMGAYETNE